MASVVELSRRARWDECRWLPMLSASEDQWLRTFAFGVPPTRSLGRGFA
jgi:hypothetical protein